MVLREDKLLPAHPPLRNIINDKTPIKLHPKLLFLLTFFSLLFVLISHSVSADVISLNSGGTTEIAVSTDRYVDGFFFGVNPVCGNGVVEDGETCDDGNTISGDGCSNICRNEEVVVGGGNQGGGGGGSGGGVSAANIIVTPSWNKDLGLKLAVNTTRDETINVSNIGSSSVTVVLSHTFGDHLQIIGGNNTFTIPVGESRTFNIRFIAGSVVPDPATVVGVITISGNVIPTSLDISTVLTLFDSNIVVLNPGLKVQQGDTLNTRVTLIPLGDPERLDVTLNFVIKDYTNKVFLTKSETLLVRNLTTLDRNFDTGLLPVGDYVVGLELVYPNGVAPSSAHFKVVEKSRLNLFGKIVLFLVIMILIVAILILIILLWKRRKKKEEENKRQN